MPRVKRIAKRRPGLTPNECKQLTDGVSMTTRWGVLHKTPDWEGLKRAWRDYGAELTAEWVANHPFTRPIMSWKFDATQPRQRVAGEAQLEAAEWNKGRRSDYRSCYFRDLNARLGAEDTRANEGEWETEKQYLCRLDLLTDEERALL